MANHTPSYMMSFSELKKLSLSDFTSLDEPKFITSGTGSSLFTYAALVPSEQWTTQQHELRELREKVKASQRAKNTKKLSLPLSRKDE